MAGCYRATPIDRRSADESPLGSIPGRRTHRRRHRLDRRSHRRVASEAGAGQTFVSRTVVDLVAGSGLTFEDPGEHELKGVPDRWRLYRVLSESA